ncbi:MAG: hypothetical protein JW982_03910 [Spirochaetes bacterium]|nr:hypothetical protein [Spirochaetota bacterium]
MYRKFLTILTAIAITGLFSISVIAQDEDTGTGLEGDNTDVVNEEGRDVNDADNAGVATETSAEMAKTFFDGVNTYVNSKVKFKLNTSDNFLADKIMYKIDDSSENEYTGEFTIQEEGKHVVKYHGIDKVGNLEDEKVFHTIVDNTAPVTNVAFSKDLVIINDKLYTSDSNILNVAASDALSGVYMINYSINDETFAEYVTSFKITTSGDTKLKVAAEDNVANTSQNFKIRLPKGDGTFETVEKNEVMIYVDKVNPTVAISADKDFLIRKSKKVASKEYKYTVSAEDNESGVKMIYYRVDGRGEFMPYESEIVFNTNGNHFIEAIAEDAVGNKSDALILSVYVDIIPPVSGLETIEDTETDTETDADVQPADEPVVEE